MNAVENLEWITNEFFDLSKVDCLFTTKKYIFKIVNLISVTKKMMLNCMR